MIKIENLCKTFHHEILKDVNVEINQGDVISIIGPSGCGKSTFLRCINQLEKPTSGHIYLDGVDLTTVSKKELEKLRQKMGMVFQSFNLFEHMTVIENIMLGPVNLLGVSKQEAYDEGMRLLRTVGLSRKAMSYPDSLSGGQKQRVAIARTLAMKPEIILFDEPTSALDPSVTSEVLGVIKKLAEDGYTMLIVTHEMEFAEHVSNRVFFMSDQGIYEDGTPEQIFHDPQGVKTKEFIYQIRTFQYDIEGSSFDYYELLSKITNFLKKQLFDRKRINEVVLMIEELIFNIIYKVENSENTKLHLTCTYTEKFNETELLLEGDMIHSDLLEKSDDELSKTLIQNISKNIEVNDGCVRIQM